MLEAFFAAVVRCSCSMELGYPEVYAEAIFGFLAEEWLRQRTE